MVVHFLPYKKAMSLSVSSISVVTVSHDHASTDTASRTSMSPVMPLNLGNRGNVPSTKRGGLTGKNDKNDSKDQQSAAPAYPESRHCSPNRDSIQILWIVRFLLLGAQLILALVFLLHFANAPAAGEKPAGLAPLRHTPNGVIGLEIEPTDLVGAFKHSVYITLRVSEEEMVGIAHLAASWGWETELNLVGKLPSSK